jgi:eukaryotic-like serine/threonine-protein kinase
MSFALQEGTVFAGRYRIASCIALGGMGAVYEVVHIETERRRALKVMLPHILQSSELRDRFKREARVAAQIDSEFIVDVFDAGVDETTGMPFLVMELLRGEEIGKRLARVGRLSPREVVAYLYQTALALDKTHRASIVHRDLKPENLFLTHREHGEPRIKVLDFGIAKFLAEAAKNAHATRSIGTPTYMAPEQFRSGKITPAVDIYALGMMSYTLLVGVPYWEPEMLSAETVYAFGVIAMGGPKEPPSERAILHEVKLPPAFNTWFARVTATKPDRRFSTATAAIEALAEVFGIRSLRSHTLVSTGADLSASSSHEVLALTSLGAGAIDTRPRRKQPVLAVGILFGFGALAIAGVTFTLLNKPGSPSPPPTEHAIVTATASTAATAETPPPALPSSDSAPVQVAPAGSASADPSALPTVSAASKPSGAPTVRPRKPPAASSASAPATRKPAEDNSIYTPD